MHLQTIKPSLMDMLSKIEQNTKQSDTKIVVSITKAERDRKLDEWIATVENYKTRPMFR